jgi:carbon storage regulator
MLVLSRKPGASIVIDGTIKVTVIEVRGNMVRLGVEAPQDIRVHRGELAARIRGPQRVLASA